jgi:hypothetical protein
MFIYKLHPNFKSDRASILTIKIDKIRGVDYVNKQEKFQPYIRNKTLIEIDTSKIKKETVINMVEMIELVEKEVQPVCTSNQSKKEIVAYIVEKGTKLSKKELNSKSKEELLLIANNSGVK